MVWNNHADHVNRMGHSILMYRIGVCLSTRWGWVGGWQEPPLGRYTPSGQVHPTPRSRYTPWSGTHPGRYSPNWAGTLGKYTPLADGQQAGGTHPTGMHSCSYLILLCVMHSHVPWSFLMINTFAIDSIIKCEMSSSYLHLFVLDIFCDKTYLTFLVRRMLIFLWTSRKGSFTPTIYKTWTIVRTFQSTHSGKWVHNPILNISVHTKCDEIASVNV